MCDFSILQACESLRTELFINAIDAPCISHTIDNAGKRFVLPFKTIFFTHWNNVIGVSGHGKRLFKDEFGVNPKAYSKVRWWVIFEQAVQLAEGIADGRLMRVLLRWEAEGVGEASTPPLLQCVAISLLNFCFKVPFLFKIDLTWL